MSKQKQLVHQLCFTMPTEEAETIKQLAQSVCLTYTGILRFLVREALVDPEATRQKIKERQQSIKALGGKL